MYKTYGIPGGNMDIHKLSFAKINILREDIAEVIINENIEMNADMVEQYHDFLLTHLHPPFSLLINKINSYSYDFQAQKNIASLNEIKAMAVVAYNQSTVISTRSLEDVPRKTKWNMRIFNDRDESLSWLISEQENY